MSPSPIPVELRAHDPAWSEKAHEEGLRLMAAAGGAILTVHHIGSTAIAGIRAKPVLDLLPVLRSLAAFEQVRAVIEALGYAWHGEYGLSGRRYCTLDDGGCRLVQAHAYEQGSPEITRHLAFRDHLRAHPELAREYESVKFRCHSAHPLDSHAYSECKSAWIKRVEAEALTAR